MDFVRPLLIQISVFNSVGDATRANEASRNQLTGSGRSILWPDPVKLRDGSWMAEFEGGLVVGMRQGEAVSVIRMGLESDDERSFDPEIISAIFSLLAQQQAGHISEAGY